MSENPQSAPRPLHEAELAAVTGGYGWLHNPVQDVRDRYGYGPSPSVADLMQDYLRQQREDLLRDARDGD
ncbi:hypothetical protein [Falsiroseomonas tokyonensis]|uniref:Uncharacterized protein n=1 Tax=Falsiroseomonas tokyonensis TaxID=430521 RepID=A0ABV7BUC8_9PROT|nr:hypothetical protein [Falsiroseomonas tokyonensis]MBU8538463.1 hypothetical protein [Falsiroseomonas tokyonensis]